MTTIGSPVRARTLARWPSDASNSATWSRTHLLRARLVLSDECHVVPEHHADRRGFRATRLGPIACARMSAIEGVSETFDPEAWDAVPGFEDLTDLTYHRARRTARCGSRSTGPTCSTRSARTPSTSCCGVLEHARTSSRRRLRAADRQRAGAEERQVGVLHRRRPADPGPRRLPVRRRARPPRPSTRRSSAGCTSWSASG